MVPGALWGSAYTLQGGGPLSTQQARRAWRAASWLLECWKRWNRVAKKLWGGAAALEAALLQAVTRDIKMATSKGPGQTPVAGTPKKEMGEALGFVLFPSWAHGNVDARDVVMEC
jgi:hypothetical protein